MKPQQQRKSWMTMKREQFGKDWYVKVKPNELFRNRLRILQDISYGNFKVEGDDMKDLMDSGLIKSLIEYVDGKEAELGEIVNSLSFIINNNAGNEKTVIVFTNCNNCFTAYKLSNEYLRKFYMTKDITIFIKFMNVINEFRNYIDLNNAL